MKGLAGTIFTFNCEIHDYCYKEAIQSLLECTDYVIVCDAGSDDGTAEELFDMQSDRLKVIFRKKQEWDEQKGREKLNYFTNIAIEEAERMGFEYQINLQADEIIHEASYDAIRKAVAGGAEAYMVRRYNLWATPYLYLNVEQSRLPCSTEIIRLAKTQYRSYGDAESINAQCVMDFVKDIRFYHMGYVRKKEVMRSKVHHMQVDVFGHAEHDKKLDQSDTFDPYLWFEQKDLSPIEEPLPAVIQTWAFANYINNNVKI